MSEPLGALTIDLEKLLSPISVERPVGESLRYEGTYDRIQEVRREDDPSLPQGIWKTSLKKADWEAVRDLCLEALETRTKDLHIAVWLLEAWMHLHGLAGVREGVKLLSWLCESFWDDLYPQLDEDDADYRCGPLIWMNEKLSVKLKTIPMTQPHTRDVPAYTWVDWESACRLENLARKDNSLLQAAEAEGKVTQARFGGSVMLSPKSFYVALARDLRDIVDAMKTFEALLEEKLGKRAPSLAQFKEVLTSMQHLVDDILLERAEETVEEDTAAADEAQDLLGVPHEQEIGLLPGTGSIRSRAEAYRRLLEAAEYLLKTEPHSPTPYLVKRAVAWGSMSLTQLLEELVSDERDLQAILILLGIRKGGER